jgi:hypothetical protein
MGEMLASILARGNGSSHWRLSAISFQLSAFSYQLSAFSFQLSAISFQLSAISFQLLKWCGPTVSSPLTQRMAQPGAAGLKPRAG